MQVSPEETSGIASPTMQLGWRTAETVPSAPVPSGSARSRAAVIFLLALTVRIGFAFGPLPVVDASFVPDDTYYVLSIARSLAAGEGPSASDGILTNGFQPLFAWLLVPLFWVGAEPAAGLRGAVVLSSIFDALCAVGLFVLTTNAVVDGRPARRTPGAAELAGIVWALSPVAVGQALNGLETSLALAAVLAVCISLGRPGRVAPAHGRPFLLGALLGVALLARIDTACLCLLVAGGLGAQRRWRELVRVASAAFLVVAPWWAYEWGRFGTIVPGSGPAVRAAALSLEPALGMTLSWAAMTAINPWFDLPAVRSSIIASPALSALTFLAVCGLGTLGLAAAWRRLASGVRHFLAFGWALLAFYVLWVPAVWFFQRYLLVTAAGTLLIAVVAWARWHDAGPRQARLARAAAGLLLGLQLFQLGAWATRGKPLDRDHNGIKGYAGPAQAILRELREARGEVVLGAFQSGALGYFAGKSEAPGIRVLNLDGVVDASALAALQSGRLIAYLEERGVTHVADWEFLVRRTWTRQRLAAAAGGDPDPQTRLVPLFTAPAQANLEFVLFALQRMETGPSPSTGRSIPGTRGEPSGGESPNRPGSAPALIAGPRVSG